MYLGLNNLGLNGMNPPFDPNYFYINNEVGDWWDASDLSLMYTDSAGTTAAAVNDPVGLMLGQRFKGQRGAELWDDASVSFTGESSKLAANVYRVRSTAGAYSAVEVTAKAVVGRLYEITFTVDSVTAGAVAVDWVGGPLFNTTGVKTARVVASYTSLLLRRNAGITDVQISNVSFREVPGIHRYQTTAPNRPTLKQDANGKYYLSYNGTNSWMQTSAVDFSGTDKMTVVGAWTKLSDAAAGALVELGTTSANTGSFLLASSGTNGTDRQSWSADVHGNGATATTTQARPYVAPHSAVVGVSYDTAKATDQKIAWRVNGASVSAGYTNSIDSGTGNFRNDILYFGARAGTSLFFNGNEYISAIAGAAKTETLIARMERFAAQRAGIVL